MKRKIYLVKLMSCCMIFLFLLGGCAGRQSSEEEKEILEHEKPETVENKKTEEIEEADEKEVSSAAAKEIAIGLVLSETN